MIILILKSNTSYASIEENYRGITISSTLSKIFEACLKRVFFRFLETDELQFGFKAGVGCRDASMTARSVIQYYTNHGDTVTVCALDISKAFNRVDFFYCLFLKLMNRNVPKVFLYLIVNWYINCTAVVKWDNFISQSFHIQAGVRQGGVLSPCLFAIYINDIVVRLCDSRLGCFIADCFIGCILYADDI